MRLRIVAGHLGGRFIQAPVGRLTRPTTGRVREAWFSAIGREVVDARVVDLFAGSGALGIEALSRGARHAHFVESDRRALSTLRSNLETLGLLESATIVRGDVFGWLASVDASWDLALADPPYGGDAASRLVSIWEANPFAPCLWVEHEDRGAGLPVDPSWSRRYGDTRVSRFRVDEESRERTDPV